MTVSAVASARADLFGVLAELLSFPNAELERAASQGLVKDALEHVLRHQAYAVTSDLSGLAPRDIAERELEAEFIRLFDVPDGPATPLYTGVYARQRREAMEELLRFYRHFGLTLARDAQDLPDFVPTVLEFVQYLALRAESGDEEQRHATSLAQADVIERHLLPWAAQTQTRFVERRPHPFYAGTLGLCVQVLRGELAWLRSETD
jgi:DMSO reductase family type II enzyme chaperone